MRPSRLKLYPIAILVGRVTDADSQHRPSNRATVGAVVSRGPLKFPIRRISQHVIDTVG